MVFWLAYAMFFILGTWFFAVSALAYWRYSHPDAPPRQRTHVDSEIDDQLLVLEAQFFLAPVLARNEARVLLASLPVGATAAAEQLRMLIEDFDRAEAERSTHRAG